MNSFSTFIPSRRLAFLFLGMTSTLIGLGFDDPLGRPDAQPAPILRTPFDPTLANKNVVFWKSVVVKDAQGAIARRELAGAYLARQRETGDIADAVLAEAAARDSLAILPRNNHVALNRLARALLTQHRFPEALEVADRAAKLDDQAERLRADILIELGDLVGARKAVSRITIMPDDLNGLALKARMASADGQPVVALKLLRQAAEKADDRPDMTAETVAWCHTMIGHTLIDSGKLDEGEAECRKALEIFPKDYRAWTGLAEAATWRKDWDEVVKRAGEALRLSPQNPEALRLLGEARAEKGETKLADIEFGRFKQLAESFPQIYDRHWILFCADHGWDLESTLTLARKDLKLRQDQGAYDALAWACFKSGKVEEAQSAIAKATALPVQDGSIYLHDAAIANAQGDLKRARESLEKAKALNPYLVAAPK